MARPWALNSHLALVVVSRRIAGHAVITIAKDLKISPCSVYNIIEGRVYTEATRSLRWKARKLLKEVKKERLRDNQSHVDYRIISNPRKILASAASLCVYNAQRIHETASIVAQREIERGSKLKSLANII